MRTAAIPLPPRQPEVLLQRVFPARLAAFIRARNAVRRAFDALPDDVVADAHLRGLAQFRSTDRRLNEVTRLLEFVGQYNGQREDIARLVEAAGGLLTESIPLYESMIDEYNLAEVKQVIADWNEYVLRYAGSQPAVDAATLRVLAAWPEAVQTFKSELRDFVAKFSEWLAQGGRAWRNERPPSSDVETLYHASVNAHMLVARGFDPEVPVGGGIGGTHVTQRGDEGISFTSDLYVALQIAKSLKEVIGIANGTYRYVDVLRWAREDGVQDLARLEANAASAFLTGREIPSAHRPIGVPSRARPHLDTPEGAFALYQTYLAFSARYNPLYFGVQISQFKGLDEAQVGVVAARVDMTDPGIDYLPAMHEYRVPPRAVLVVDRLIADRPMRAATRRVAARDVWAAAALGIVTRTALK